MRDLVLDKCFRVLKAQDIEDIRREGCRTEECRRQGTPRVNVGDNWAGPLYEMDCPKSEELVPGQGRGAAAAAGGQGERGDRGDLQEPRPVQVEDPPQEIHLPGEPEPGEPEPGPVHAQAVKRLSKKTPGGL